MIAAAARAGRPSLYVHTPFCVAKCGYCDFNSHVGEGRDLARYVRALLAEARGRAPAAPPTVFVGGGTPTYLPVGELRDLFLGLRALGAFDAPGVEVTVEANPESATEEKLGCLRDLGATRLSLGVQSFRERDLRRFDRVHGPEHVVRAVEAARKVGFARVNLDLIFAKPGETLQEWRADLAAALALRPDHLSCYELMYEEGTAIARERSRGRLEPQDQESCAAFYHDTIAALGFADFEHYETSAFARPGEMCRHNLVYWTSGDWVGIGAGAGSSVGPEKWLNLKNPEAYAAAIEAGSAATDAATRERSAPAARLAEVLMMGLRLLDGIELGLVADRSGEAALAARRPEIEYLVEEGLLRLEGDWLMPTARGRDVLDLVVSRFLPS